MTKEIQLVIDALGKVGEKVGEGTEYFWPLLIQNLR